MTISSDDTDIELCLKLFLPGITMMFRMSVHLRSLFNAPSLLQPGSSAVDSIRFVEIIVGRIWRLSGGRAIGYMIDLPRFIFTRLSPIGLKKQCK